MKFSYFCPKPGLMRKPLLFIFLLILSVSILSCRSSRPVASKGQSGPLPSVNVRAGSPEERYINLYSEIAIKEMKRTGVPASITLAQGMIESDMGRSRLAVSGNNHFGIKCHNGWTGATIYHNDDRRNDCFRKYRSAEESFRDHSDFLKSGSRYSFLFNLKPDDYRGWASGLRKAGYATNPDYANMVIRKIEDLNLSVFDRGYVAQGSWRKPAEKSVNSSSLSNAADNGEVIPVASKGITARPERIFENNRIKYIVVRDGETRDKIEKEFQLLRWELPKYNELNADFTPVPGQVLYLQPKREKAEPGKEYHTVAEGDTMYLISQRYGIKLKSLYELNRMETGKEPQPGSRIRLRTMKPVN